MMNDVKCYLITEKKNNSLYAISTSKKEVKEFLKMRDTNLFKISKEYFTQDEFQEFISDNGTKRIKESGMKIGDRIIDILITYDELFGVMRNNVLCTLDTANSTINPNIFNKKYFNHFHNIGYINKWMIWEYGTDEDDKSSFFNIFMLIYGYTMDLFSLERKLKNERD